MYEIDFNKVSDKEQSKIITASVIPRPIAWITSINENGLVNLAPFSFFQAFSKTLVGVSFLRKDGKLKHTAQNVLNNKEAVIHIADQSLIEKLDLSSKQVEEDISEVDLSNLTLTNSKKVSVAAIKEPKIRLEVILDKHLELVEDGEITADLIIFKVLYVHLDAKVYDPISGYIDAEKLNPLSRLGGPHYGNVTQNKDFKRKFR